MVVWNPEKNGAGRKLNLSSRKRAKTQREICPTCPTCPTRATRATPATRATRPTLPTCPTCPTRAT